MHGGWKNVYDLRDPLLTFQGDTIRKNTLKSIITFAQVRL